MKPTPLKRRLVPFRRRLLWTGVIGAAFWGAVVATVAMIVAVWLDLIWQMPPGGRIALSCLALAAAAVWSGRLLWRTLVGTRYECVVRLLDRVGGTGGQILSGWELDQSVSPGGQLNLTAGLAQLAADRATAIVAGIAPRSAVPIRPVVRAAVSAAAVFAMVGAAAVCLPDLARTQWQRFRQPFADVPAYSRTRFEVTPGDVTVLYGGSLEIAARAMGAPVDQVQLVLEGRAQGEVLPMFPEPDGRWRTALAKVTEPAVYYVRAGRARSRRYRIGVITVPRIEAVRVRIEPPPYANRRAYEGPVPRDGIAGLPGTTVRLWARSNRPLSGGELAVSYQGRTSTIAMKPTGRNGQEAAGEFVVEGDGKFLVNVIDVAGQRSREPFAGTITVLADQRPFIRLLEPKAKSLATPTAHLPVTVAAEDDYGISRVLLFRSLNDSRPLPAEIDLPGRPSRRVYERRYLPLADYGLQPGDVIKLFGRVEDTDPAGAKGAESTVVSVTIISQEEFERMLRLRQGVEVLTSKYYEARRRLERLVEEVERLRDELKKADPASAVTRQRRRQLQRLVRRLREESEALRKLAQRRLPYDLDRYLGPQLESLARLPNQLAAELEKLLQDAELHYEELLRQLEKLTGRLADEWRGFRQQVIVPLEELEAVFPLIVDQGRFVILVLRQMDLAERTSALKGMDGQDSPSLKARMRDLEDEQRRIRENLQALLTDIEDHVRRLPEEPHVEPLRRTASEFVEKVRASGAQEAMAAAESALSEFAGSKAHQKANEAAEILKRFLRICQAGGMMAVAKGCLIFQPALGQGLGQTIAQLLADLGLPAAGAGGGMGTGFGWGYSAMRSGFGLYGGLPGMIGGAWGQYGSGQESMLSPAQPGQYAERANPDEALGRDMATIGTASGITEQMMPPRFRRRVGQYFQRIVEEAGQ